MVNFPSPSVTPPSSVPSTTTLLLSDTYGGTVLQGSADSVGTWALIQINSISEFTDYVLNIIDYIFGVY